jgi:peptidyl-prolyl cis-trans isomerase SurA
MVRTRRAAAVATALVALSSLFACGDGQEEAASQSQQVPIDEAVWVRHILIQYAGAYGAPPDISRNRASADSLAREVHKLALAGGQDFRALAKKYSDDAAAEAGGEIAPLEPGDGPPEFMQTAMALQIGEISEVVESAYGFHIIQRRDTRTMTAQHILIRYAGAHSCPDSITRTRDEALQLMERLVAMLKHPDASFPVAARDFSEDETTAPHGGYLGTFPRGKMDPNFEKVAFALEEDEVSDVIETPYGLHLIRRVEPKRIRVSHILLTYAATGQLVEASRTRQEALERALDAAFRAKQGEDFAALAREYSDDPASAERGGRLSPMRHGIFVPEFEDAAFRLQPGEVSDVVETEFGFHVIKRLD